MYIYPSNLVYAPSYQDVLGIMFLTVPKISPCLLYQYVNSYQIYTPYQCVCQCVSLMTRANSLWCSVTPWVPPFKRIIPYIFPNRTSAFTTVRSCSFIYLSNVFSYFFKLPVCLLSYLFIPRKLITIDDQIE